MRSASSPSQALLPQGFSYVKDFLPNIQVNIRYATPFNFYGEVLPGYESNVAMGSTALIQGLVLAQEQLTSLGYDMVLYEVYRPKQAGFALYEWAQTHEAPAPGTQEAYFPQLSKNTLFEQGYIARQSSHTRGGAVDLTLIPRGQMLHSLQACTRVLKDGRPIVYLDDGTCDMGTHFDFLDEASHGYSPLISNFATRNRVLLNQVMTACGFKGYSKEWWHYQLVNEMFPETYFDFPVR